MCGRFSLVLPPEVLAAFFELESIPAELKPRYNITPGQRIAVIRLTRHRSRRLDFIRWGLVPHWAKSPAAGTKMINARRETLHEKPAYGEAFRRRRCLIPASGFFEWQRRQGGVRTPHFVEKQGGDCLAFAGLWERWCDPRGPSGTPHLDSCTIITTPAERPLSSIHDRAPAIIPRRAWSRWLDRDDENITDLGAMLAHPADLKIRPVGPWVNNPQIADRRCIAPLEE